MLALEQSRFLDASILDILGRASLAGRPGDTRGSRSKIASQIVGENGRLCRETSPVDGNNYANLAWFSLAATGMHLDAESSRRDIRAFQLPCGNVSRIKCSCMLCGYVSSR